MEGRWLATCLLVLLGLQAILAFKEHDFKKCSDSAFCQRLRGKTGDVYSVLPDSLVITGSTATAKLRNQQEQAEFDLQLTAHDGVLRVHINEDPSKKRFEVPGVLLADLDQRQTSWSGHSKGETSAQLSLGSAEVTLTYSPLRIDVSMAGQPAASFNSRQMFNFEHLREKQEGDPDGWWQETFKGHVDSKPKGPEAISFDLTFPDTQHVYGLPERATSLSLNPTAGEGVESEPYRLYNLDVFEYEDESPFGLYGAIPFLLAHKPGLTQGAFWLNAAEMYVDVLKGPSGTETRWIAESGVLDLFLLLGPAPSQVTRQYASLTGTTAMPQYFAIAYHQCRWNYRDEADTRAVDAGFDQHDIPYDVIWLDIEHTDGKKYFTWDPAHFPNPKALQDDLASRGRKTVTIIDPHIKRDNSYYIYDKAQKKGLFVNDKDGKEYDGWCWPGSSSYLDMLHPEVLPWWSQQFQLSNYQGSTKNLYVWNDMNEPSVFNGPEITMPKDNLHYGGVEHRDLHNLYGLLYHAATANGLKERGKTSFGSDGDRPFVLSRAFFAGTQRHGPIWTGDNTATWEHMRVSLPMLMAIGLTGLPFSGADVGGFFGNPEPELLVRWYQVATYYPFLRGHAHLDTKRREPWLFGEEATTRIRTAIRARYALLPYYYTLFRQSFTHGAPLLRPLWFEFPDAVETFAMQDEFMLGPAMLVAPVMEPGAQTREVYLPAGSRWYDAITGEEAKAGRSTLDVTMDSVPVYYRGGHIVARKERPRRNTAAMANDPFTLVIALDDTGSAEGQLYVDDGHSFAFERGVFAHRQLTFKDGTLSNTAFTSPAPVVPVSSSQKYSSPAMDLSG
ncbi:hypothetical protein WJX72_003707 [[Myrmecia] bisecta]|uniref:Glucosidase II subunit alpha n=1 Tax=[Myrmecia] bisecta TaxID=41462 RepID=A0AAW1Q8L7_9CHLO